MDADLIDPETADPEQVVVVGHLTKQYSSSVRAVDDLAFTVRRGQVCGLLGPNGAGKTTTLRIMVGLVRATAGDVSLFGQPIRAGAPVLSRVGVMIEQAAFVPYLSGLANLKVYWESGGGTFDDADLDAALDIAGLGTAIDRKVKTYSQGMRQRLGLARAMLGRPELLLLDEPTNGLDPQEMRAVRDLIRELSAREVTVLLSSHLLSEIEQVCSDAVVMDRGRLVIQGSVRSLLEGATSAYVEVDDPLRATEVLTRVPGVSAVAAESPGLSVKLDGARRPELVAALVHAGVAVETVTARHRLEDAFLGLVGEETVR